MSAIENIVGFVFCLGGLNPLCWGGCASVDKDPSPQEEFDNSSLAQEAYKLKNLTAGVTSSADSEHRKVELVAEWVARNFYHFDEHFAYSDYSSTGDSRFEIQLKDIFEKRAVGCHLAGAVMILMLQSIEIDAVYLRETDGHLSYHGHGVVFIPSINRYVHGDALASTACIPGHEYLMTEIELEALYNSEPYGIGTFFAYVNNKYHYYVHLDRNIDLNSLYISGCAFTGITDSDVEILTQTCGQYTPLYWYDENDSSSQCEEHFSSDYVPIEYSFK